MPYWVQTVSFLVEPWAYLIEAAELRSQATLVVRGQVSPTELGDFLGSGFAQVAEVAREDGMSIGGPPFARFHPVDDGWDVEAGFPVGGMLLGQAQVKASRLPGGPVLRTVHVGAYTDTERAHQALQDWAEEHDLEPNGDPWEVYLDVVGGTSPHTEVVLPIHEVREERSVP